MPPFLSNPDAHPVALTLLLADKYGKEWVGWEPETLWSTLAQDFIAPSFHTRAKLQAIRTLLLNDTFHKRWEVFAPVCQAVNNNLPDFSVCRPASVPQLFHAVWVAEQVGGKKEYEDEVKSWIAACALTEGIVFLPPPLDFAQKEAEMAEYRCKKCGNVDPDESTPQCDWCGAPPSDLERRPRYLDPGTIARFWDHVKDKPSGSVVLQEDIVGIHLARLLVARDYLKMRQAQAESQVRDLGLWR